MKSTRVRHEKSIVKLGRFYFWRCSCNESSGTGVKTYQEAEKRWTIHARRR